MKFSFAILSIFLLTSCANGKDTNYTGSTPADNVVRSFLGIPFPDSIDFIRWKLELTDRTYKLHCNYGIGKPNTNGFINGGKTIEFKGPVKFENNRYRLQNGDKTLILAELNADILHVLSTDDRLLVGNAGWSYALNKTLPGGSNEIDLINQPDSLLDSMTFQGRTPCKIPGVVVPGCYKLKWSITLYANAKLNKPLFYKVRGTAWGHEKARTGNWSIIKGKDGRIIYRLTDESGHPLLNFIKLDGNILVFTDTEGKLLVGNEDFSYVLNRKF